MIRVMPNISYACVDSQTLALALVENESRWRAFSSLTVGDKIRTYNVKTNAFEWQKIQHLHIYDINKKKPRPKRTLLLKSDAHSSLTTADHKWPVKAKEEDKFITKIRTSASLEPDDYIMVYPTGMDILNLEMAYVRVGDMKAYWDERNVAMWSPQTPNGNWVAMRDNKTFITGDSVKEVKSAEAPG